MMRWLIFSLVLLAARSVAAEPPPTKSPSEPPREPLVEFTDEPRTIVCLGDSVTGVYYHTGGLRAYPEMLELALRRMHPRAKLRVVNAGISGHTTQLGLDRLDRDVLAHRPDIVTVSFGLNDLRGIPPDQFRKNLEQIVARCRERDSRIVLCTPNAVLTTEARPTERLEEYCQIIRSVAEDQEVSLCDQYSAGDRLRKRDAWAWRLTLSDEIHPNMAGHKRMAEKLAQVIGGVSVSLDDVGPPDRPLRKTQSLLKQGKSVRVLAMSPYHSAVAAALKTMPTDSAIEVLEWPVEGKSLLEIEQFAMDKVRALKVDLVVLAIPAAAYSDPGRALEDEAFVRAYSWAMNWSLSFGVQEWDCVVIHPAVTRPGQVHARNELVRQLVRAQDLTLIDRAPDDSDGYETLFARWVAREL